MSQLLISFIFLIIFTTLVQTQTIQDQTLLSDSFSNVMITLNPSVEPIIKQIEEQEFESLEAKRFALVENMGAMTQAAQGPLLFLLEDLKSENMIIKSFWITNGIIVRNFPLALLELVLTLSLPLNIISIERELEFPILPTFDSGPVLTSAPQVIPGITWGVDSTRAPEVWKLGFSGQSITVGVIDTGCLHTHEALVGRVDLSRCLDPDTKLTNVPDLNGHGTHVTGTICGKNIGVAPNATAIVCKGCGTSTCMQSSLLTCGQHMTCPIKSSSGKCMGAPKIVSNSWGGGANSTAFDNMIDSWLAAEIFPVFAAGNSGPGCKSANSPGDRPKVVAVGAVSKNANITSFSSRGPAVAGGIKPDISAPGADVLSALHLKNDGYQSLSGTSMACPHVAGVAAIIVSACPTITVAQLRAALTGSTNQALVSSGAICDGTKDNQWPNNFYGSGFVDAVKALNLALQLVKPKV